MTESNPRLQRATISILTLFLLAIAPSAIAQTDWTARNSATNEVLSDVIYDDDGEKFIAVGEGGTILSSPNGETWSVVASGTDLALRSIVHGGGKFVAVGETGTILTSADGLSWSAQDSGITEFISGVAFGSGKYVAVGGLGKILTSADAVNWSPADSRTSRFLQSVAFADDMFVAVGLSGVITTSPDGLTWSRVSTGRSEFLTAVTYFDGSWLIAGQAGVLLSSQDAQSWHLQSTGTAAWIRSLVSNADRVLAVSEDGTILLSFDGAIWQSVDSGVTDVVLAGAGFGDGQFVVVGDPFVDGPGAPTALILTSPQVSAVRWELPEVTVREDAVKLVVEILRSAPTAGSADVALDVIAGSAQVGIDFASPAGLVRFADGSGQATVIIPIRNNPEVEPAETFDVFLSLPSGGALQLVPPARLRVTIIDAQDSDADGLLDDWEISHFGTVEAYAAGDDPDSDHNDNAREFDDATDPSDPSSARYRLELSIATGTGTIEASPAAASYLASETVSLTAISAADGIFAGWGGDASGVVSPLDIVMDRDKVVAANFSLPFEEALDTAGQSLEWATAGSGDLLWVAQQEDSWDGIDAITASGGSAGESSSVYANVFGPVKLSFYWKLDPAPGAKLTFSIDGAPNLVTSDTAAWKLVTIPIPAGSHEIRWTYAKSAAGSAGTGRAGLDRVAVDRSYGVWASAIFTPEELDNPTIAAPSADPDHEGLPNILEYLLDLDPKRASWSSPNAPKFFWVEVDGVSTPGLSYQRVTARLPGFEIMARASGDLTPGSWQALGGGDVLSTSGFFETVRILDPAAATGAGRRYYQLQVVEPAEQE